jgi:hypothetical protein
MSDAERTRADDLNKQPESTVEARLRASGSSLPGGRNGILGPAPAGSRVLRPAPAPTEKVQTMVEQTLAPQEKAPAPLPEPVAAAQQPSGFQRALGAVRGVAGVMQKILPLLDGGSVAYAVSSLLAPRSPSPGPAANLAPVEDALVKLHAEQREMRGQIGEQNTSLKRVADQLEMVKEATDRNTLEQQELVDDLHSMRRKVTVFAWVGLGLLAVSIVVNVVLFLRLQRVLP